MPRLINSVSDNNTLKRLADLQVHILIVAVLLTCASLPLRPVKSAMYLNKLLNNSALLNDKHKSQFLQH